MISRPKPDWEPAKTRVFIVGTLSWADSESFAAFDPKDRRDQALADFFLAQGVPAKQVVLLQDEAATAAAIDQALAKLLKQTRPGELLVVYYCGHGYRLESGAAYFASYDACDEIPGWSMDTLPATIREGFAGDKVLLIADCCSSGCLTAAVAKEKGLLGFAALSSCSATEGSTENWTFTDTLLAGLRGEVWSGAGNDGRLTLAELAAQIAADMAFAEEQQASFVTMGTFDPDLVIAPARPKVHARIGERVEVREKGEWYKARIIGIEGKKFRVHFYGYDDSEDATVGLKSIRQPPKSTYAIGDQVEVREKGKWFPATILAINARNHLVHYADYDNMWDEWVGSRRIRKPKSE